MEMKNIYTSQFKNEIGTVSSYIESDLSDSAQISNVGNSTLIRTKGHSIQLIEFKLDISWIPKGMSFEDSKGWIWKIDKINNIKEQLELNCIIVDPSEDLTSARDTGEWLDALEIENESKVLHIGTEDSESLYSRAQVSDCMPIRFIKIFGDDPYGFSFTDYLDFGFKTIIPELNTGEQIYFHYLSAINSIKPSLQYPDERDVSTWYAVEQTEKFLENELQIKYIG
jgi:hypothetical protein